MPVDRPVGLAPVGRLVAPELGPDMFVAEEPEPDKLAAEEQDVGTEPVAGTPVAAPGKLAVEPGLST